MKRCSKCGERKALKEFHRDRRHSDGRRSECILCESAHKQSYYTQNQSSIRTRRKVLHRANPEKNRKWCRKWRADHPEYTLAANRHITIEEALAALAVKPKTCEICGRSVKLEYDHDHHTNQFRGWLCHGCNVGLGAFRNSPQAMRNAADYLERK